jgi:hypothetical protein
MASNVETADHRKSTPEMLGEFFRELALLVPVIVPLEFFLQERQSYLWHVMIAAILISGLLPAGSIIMERTRRAAGNCHGRGPRKWIL